jgi:hypothetical protein
MKTKAKLMLGISVMTAAVLAAGVTSTFAWLTTQSKATLTTGEMTVSTVSNITINVTKLGYDTAVPQAGGFGTATNQVVDSNQPLGVVSSKNGMNFYAPKALKDQGPYVASEIDEVTTKNDWEHVKNQGNGYGNGYVSYMKYGIHVEAAAEPGNGRTLNYKITPTVTDAELKESYRVALIDADDDSTYMSGALVNKIYSFDGETKHGWGASGNSFAAADYETAELGNGLQPTSLELKTTSAIDHYYVFSIWVEGEDTNATNDGISGATLKVALEFSLV